MFQHGRPNIETKGSQSDVIKGRLIKMTEVKNNTLITLDFPKLHMKFCSMGVAGEGRGDEESNQNVP